MKGKIIRRFKIRNVVLRTIAGTMVVVLLISLIFVIIGGLTNMIRISFPEDEVRNYALFFILITCGGVSVAGSIVLGYFFGNFLFNSFKPKPVKFGG